MQIARNVSLKPYNTFGIEVKAAEFSSVETPDELRQLLSQKGSLPFFILSGGSNILLTKDLEAHVIHINPKGKEVLKTGDDSVVIREVTFDQLRHQLDILKMEQNLAASRGHDQVDRLFLFTGDPGQL